MHRRSLTHRSSIALAALLVAACGSGPSVTPTPSASGGTGAATPTPALTERPFEREAWPASGSACDLEGYAGLLGRIEATSVRVVRFTLCRPDGAFLARLAHPALGVIDGSSVAAVERDPGAARGAAGAGAFRVEAWTPGADVRLERVTGEGATTRIVIRWATPSAERSRALRDAVVDGIDDPSPADAAELATLPEITVLPRPGLATAYLGFGANRAFRQAAVRRALAQGLDRAALARDAFPAGSAAATHLAPCAVAAGCAGLDWYEFNGPAGAAGLALAGWDPKRVVRLDVPDAPVPGLPDPAAAGAAVRDQLVASLGIKVELNMLPAGELRAAIAAGEVDGLYLWGVASALADASGFLEPLVGRGATGTAATRAKAVRDDLEAASAVVNPIARVEAFATASDAVRGSAAILPLVHPGTTAAYRADVEGIAVSPMGADPLGDAVPADRRQLVVMAPAEPAASWCTVSPDAASLRLCALVTPGLFALDGASLDPVPALAARCTPSDDARTWTCRLRESVVFAEGKHLDAGDVLASFRAVADAASPLRAALPPDRFGTWDGLFGGPVPDATGSP